MTFRRLEVVTLTCQRDRGRTGLLQGFEVARSGVEYAVVTLFPLLGGGTRTVRVLPSSLRYASREAS